MTVLCVCSSVNVCFVTPSPTVGHCQPNRVCHPLSFLPQLPKSKDTSVMSGAGFKRLMVTVGSAVKSIATKKTDTDQVCCASATPSKWK